MVEKKKRAFKSDYSDVGTPTTFKLEEFTIIEYVGHTLRKFSDNGTRKYSRLEFDKYFNDNIESIRALEKSHIILSSETVDAKIRKDTRAWRIAIVDAMDLEAFNSAAANIAHDESALSRVVRSLLLSHTEYVCEFLKGLTKSLGRIPPTLSPVLRNCVSRTLKITEDSLQETIKECTNSTDKYMSEAIATMKSESAMSCSVVAAMPPMIQLRFIRVMDEEAFKIALKSYASEKDLDSGDFDVDAIIEMIKPLYKDLIGKDLNPDDLDGALEELDTCSTNLAKKLEEEEAKDSALESEDIPVISKDGGRA